MKKTFTIFYSWQTDTHKSENYSYIQKILEKTQKEIKSLLDVSIDISTDSREASGSKSIDVTILEKITCSDFFIADITPKKEIQDNNVEEMNLKLFPNPNVMFELGYAVNSLGWNRIILVWNDKYGNKTLAPFDIRNHLSVSYYKDIENKDNDKNLNLTNIISDKISNYDQLLIENQKREDLKFDLKLFFQTEEIVAERTLLDSIHNVCKNLAYYKKESDYWDNLIYRYTENPQYKYIDPDIHNAYSAFINILEEMKNKAMTYFDEVSFDPPRSNDDRLFKVKNYYDIYDGQNEAFDKQQETENIFIELHNDLKKLYDDYRHVIKVKLHV